MDTSFVTFQKYNDLAQLNEIAEILQNNAIDFEIEDQSPTFGLIDSRSYKEIRHSTYWNIAFYHTKTHTYHLLDEKRRMLIYELNDLKSGDNGSPDPMHIFYRITTTDTNGDKRFNSDDLSYLFVSDRTGKDFYQLSPPNYELVSWKRMKASTKIIMLARKDTNGNKKYNAEDEIVAFMADLTDKQPAKEIFSPQDKQKLKTLFDRDWKRVL